MTQIIAILAGAIVGCALAVCGWGLGWSLARIVRPALRDDQCRTVAACVAGMFFGVGAFVVPLTLYVTTQP